MKIQIVQNFYIINASWEPTINFGDKLCCNFMIQTRVSSEWKFCPGCGEKIEREYLRGKVGAKRQEWLDFIGHGETGKL